MNEADSAYAKMESTLKKYFGYSEFRPYQKEVIEKILEKRDCLVVMATGSGKSLCYQVPPLVTGSTAVVISPLISLMQDQVMALKQHGIRAEYIGSSQKDRTIQAKAECGNFDVVFMTPEKACIISASFWMKLMKAGICLLAVDEAHCISEWGHDFRVEYKQLYKLRNSLLDVPFVGLTATATAKVRADIVNSMKLKDPYIAVGSFDRRNLFYGVKSFIRGRPFLDQLVREVSQFIASAGSTIIYCTTVKDVEQIYQLLQEAGMKAGIYHGQMDNIAREESHRLFIRDELHVMVATIAFGMGIDKPNIRYVIHYGCPKSLESYYQESGRCGRDGIASVCWLYYTRCDFGKADFYCGDLQTANQRRAVVESLMDAEHYCLLTTCRRKFLLQHFGEIFSVENCGNCDNCTTTRMERDMSKEAFLLLACIQSCRGNWGLNMPIDVLRGSRSKKVLGAQFDKLPLHGLGKDHSANWWKALACLLISQGYLKETITDVYRTVSVAPKGLQYLNSARPDYQPPLVLPLSSEMVDDETCENTIAEVGGSELSEFEGLTEAEAQLCRMLLEERMKLARDIGTAPHAICGDQTIKRIALTRPSTRARLANIDGVNQNLLMSYGNYFLQSIRHISEKLNLPLDGSSSIHAAIVRKVHPPANLPSKLTPAKFEAWKLWHEDGLSIQKVANFPGRSAPVKEQTILNYILEAAQEGCAIDWPRFCKEIELTSEMCSDIQAAVNKVGSTEKLKPIKDELPDNVSYAHIKTYMVMHSCGFSPTILAEQGHSLQSGDLCNGTELSPHSPSMCQMEEPCEVATVANGSITICSSSEKHKEAISLPVGGILKRQKLAEEASHTFMEATESSLINWLKNNVNGVALPDIFGRFKGSDEDIVCSLLSRLESEFIIYKKNNIYRLF